jgi:hypothetical protein
LILIDHHPAATLIAIEAKMFSAIRPKRLESQMQRQREKILCPLRELLKVKIPEVKILHLALLPQKLIEAWKKDCPSELSALRASCIRIVTWENILAPFKKGGLASYWVAMLETALGDFSRLRSTIQFGTNNDNMLTGGEIVEGFGSDGFYPMMGRAGGLNGSPLKEDLEKGTWKTHQYEVKSSTDQIPNWFLVSDFIHKIALQSAKA